MKTTFGVLTLFLGDIHAKLSSQADGGMNEKDVTCY